MVKNAYSIVHPMFLKVVETINSSETLEHINASQLLAGNFITYIETSEDLGIFPVGYNRAVLATYYGQEINKLIEHQIRICTSND